MLYKKQIYLLAVLLLTGCTSSPSDVKPMQLEFDQDNFAQDAIVKAFDNLTDSAAISAEANISLANLANGEASLNMSRKEFQEYIFQSSYVPKGMEKDIDITWSGPIMPVLQTLADLSGYKVAAPATRPLNEPTIVIDSNQNIVNKQYYGNRSLRIIDVIRAISAANQESVRIVVHEKIGVIELFYL